MNKTWIITRRELKIFFNSLMAYIMLVLFLGFSGFFTWLYGADVFLSNQASLRSFFSIAYWTLFFFIPALTMGLIADENRTGTIELLLTKPVSDWQVVTGKFFAALLLIAISLLLTLPYYITVWKLGPVDHGAVWCGYLGLLLMSASYIAIGIFASSITGNQIIAFLLTLLIGIFFHVISDVLASNFTGIPGAVLDFLNMSTHFDGISRGVIDSRDILFFLTLIFTGLFASEAMLAKRNLRD